MSSSFLLSKENLQQASSIISDLRFLVIGETCTDVWVYGASTRLSPEAPIPILKVSRDSKRVSSLGMSANTRQNLCSLGVKRENISHVTQNELIIKQRFVDEHHNVHVLRLDTEDECSPLVLDAIDFTLQNYDAIVISDYDKGFITNEFAKALCKKAKEKSIHVFVDTKKNDIECYCDATIIKVNEKERKSLISTRHNPAMLVTTMGSLGAEFENKLYKTNSRQVCDVTGAGDVFLAGLAITYTVTKNIHHSIMFANHVAGMSVEKFGTVSIDLEEACSEWK